MLKGWVESASASGRAYHHAPLGASPAAQARYALDRIRGSAKTNAIDSQLDLLFEFCQYELARRHPGELGSRFIAGRSTAATTRRCALEAGRKPFVRMNNISSFTADRECAWEFGSTVWEVRVPLSKIFFFSGLLPDNMLKGEDEFMVIGGEYRVRRLRW